MKYFVVFALSFLVSACASNPPASVVDRTAPLAKPKSVVVADNRLNKNTNSNDWRPDYHVVKKGDTLISLGLQYGYYYKDIATANNIESPFIIKIGQIINLSSINAKPGDNSIGKNGANNNTTQEDEGVVLTPLDSDSITSSNTVITNDIKTPTNSSTVIKPNATTKPLDTSAVASTKPIEIPLITEPKAVREPYSLAALNRAGPAQTKLSTKSVVLKPTESKTIEPKIDAKVNKPAEVETTSTNDVAKDVTSGEVLNDPIVKDNQVKSTDAQALQWIWPTQGKVVANFNEASNKGLDIGGSMGQTINAASAGKVIYSGSDLRGYGKLVIIKHNKTYLSVYAHNSKIIVKEGMNVSAGQKIAEMGDTDSNSVKLHFEIRRLGKSVNPTQYLN